MSAAMNATPTDGKTAARPVRVEDLPLVGDLLDDVFRRSRGVFDQSQLTDFPLVFAAQNVGHNRLISEDGLVVSHAALWPREFLCDGQKFKTAIVACVATHPKYRHRGYAASLMRSLQQQLDDDSYDFAILWTAVPDFYHQLGWQLVTPRGVLVALTRALAQRVAPGGFQCLPFDSSIHLDAVQGIYNQNAVRLSRDRYQAERLFSLPKVSTWVAARDEQVVAYVCHAQAINKQGITEYGGELDGIMTLLGHISASLKNDQRLPLLIYPSRPDLAARARELGWPTQPLPSSKGSNHEMVYEVSHGRLPAEVRDRLFVWGLDHA